MGEPSDIDTLHHDSASGGRSTDRFRWGVASGDPTATSVVIWTRIADAGEGDGQVDWKIRCVDDGRVVRRGTAATSADSDHTLHVEIDDLEPDTDYAYCFSLGADTAGGLTRTLPRHASRLRFCVVCCSRWGWPGFDRYAAVADEQPAFVLHLGDSIYELGETPPSGVTTDPPWSCHSLTDYRRRHRQHQTSPALQRLQAAVPTISVWDDHEVVDDGPEPGNAERRRDGQRAWREWTPMRDERGDSSIERFVSVDGLLDLALVDTRFSGRRPSDIGGPAAEGDGVGHLLDSRQWPLLQDFARSAAAPWFVFANQVQVGPMTLGARPALAWPPWRRIVNPDQWDGYPDERDRLYRILGQVTGRPVVISGDLHSSWSRSLRHTRRTVAHEFTAPSISGATYAEAVRDRAPIAAPALTAWLRVLNRGIGLLDLTRHGYLVCDVTPERFTTTFVTHDGGRRSVVLGAR